MSENKKRQRAFKYKMDDFCSTQLCAGKETCMLDPQRISVSEHNGPFLDLKRAATLIMQLSLSLLTVNNSTKRWPWQIWGEKGGVIIVPESENKDTEWWLNSSPSLFHTSYTSHTSVGYLQKKKESSCCQGQWWEWEYRLCGAVWSTREQQYFLSHRFSESSESRVNVWI